MPGRTCDANEQQIAPLSSCPPHTPVRDQDLLSAIADGDVEALDLLYERYYQQLYSLAYRIIADHHIAEDLIQETFLRVWRRAATYSAQTGSVRVWLFAILRNYAIDYLRKQRQQTTPTEVPLGEIEYDERFALADTWEEVWRRETQIRLRQALQRLPEKQRVVLELSYFQGYTHVEIADLTGLPLGTVKSAMRLGLLALKRDLTIRHALGTIS